MNRACGAPIQTLGTHVEYGRVSTNNGKRHGEGLDHAGVSGNSAGRCLNEAQVGKRHHEQITQACPDRTGTMLPLSGKRPPPLPYTPQARLGFILPHAASNLRATHA